MQSQGGTSPCISVVSVDSVDTVDSGSDEVRTKGDKGDKNKGDSDKAPKRHLKASSSDTTNVSWTHAMSVVARDQSLTDQAQEELLSISESEEQSSMSAFWLPMLIHDTEASGFEIPERKSVLLVSSCSGCCAEAAVLKDRKIK